MSQADPKFSAGARLERRAFREYLRRRLNGGMMPIAAVSDILAWVLKRQSRYDKRPKGLGK